MIFLQFGGMGFQHTVSAMIFNGEKMEAMGVESFSPAEALLKFMQEFGHLLGIQMSLPVDNSGVDMRRFAIPGEPEERVQVVTPDNRVYVLQIGHYSGPKINIPNEIYNQFHERAAEINRGMKASQVS